MKPVFKKITGLTFILVTLLPFLLPFLLDVKQDLIRRMMRKKVESSRQLQTVIIPQAEVIWMDEHEIWVNERMFDISSMKLQDRVYTFTGLYDEDETNLVKQRNKLSEKERKENKVLSLLFLCFQHVICDDRLPDNSLPVADRQNHFIFSEEEIETAYPVLIPPPKSLLL